jgi:hypothetical protein
MRETRPNDSPLNVLSPLFQSQPVQDREGDRRRAAGKPIAVFFLLAAITTGIAFAQTETQSLAERSSIIVRGKVLKTNASDEPLVEPSDRTAIISVEQMYAGQEIAGDQTGRTATVILSKPEGVKAGEEAVFFGNPRFLGKSITISDEAEAPGANASAMVSTMQQGTQARRDKPVLDRLAVATLVFRGTVSAVKPLQGAAGAEGKRSPESTSEHDPEWQVATVQISKPLRGGEAGQKVTVIFAASRDIVWFYAPKLKAGQDAVFIAHAPNKDEQEQYRGSSLAQLLQKQTIYLVTEPSDVLPPADEDRVRGLLATPKETK